MSLSNEWEEMYLTHEGWVQGSTKLDFQGVNEVEKPANAILKVYRKVYVGAIGAKPDVSESQIKYTDDQSLIDDLITKFGKAQFGV